MSCCIRATSGLESWGPDDNPITPEQYYTANFSPPFQTLSCEINDGAVVKIFFFSGLLLSWASNGQLKLSISHNSIPVFTVPSEVKSTAYNRVLCAFVQILDYSGGRTLDDLIQYVERKVAGIEDDDDDDTDSDDSDDEGEEPEGQRDEL